MEPASWGGAAGFASYGLGEMRRIMVKTVDALLCSIHYKNGILPPIGRQEGFRRAARERASPCAAQPALDL